MRAGVSIVDPDGDGDRRRRGDRQGHRDRAVHDDQGQHEDRRGLHCQAFIPHRLRARGRRERGAVRLPAPGDASCAPARRSARSWRSRTPTSARREGPAPVLHRRCGRGRGDQPRREHDHRQLRRPRQAPHDDRQARAHERGHDARRAGDGRRRRLYGRWLGDHRGRARQARWAWRARARPTSRAMRERRETGCRSSRAIYTPSADEQRDRHAHAVLAGEPADRLQQAADAVQRAREPAAGGRHRGQARRRSRPG